MMHLYAQLSLTEGTMDHIVLDAKNPTIATGMKNLVDAQKDWNALNPDIIANPSVRNRKKAFYSMRHSKGFDIDDVVKAVNDMKAVADRVMARSKEMVALKLSLTQAKKIVRDLPKVVSNKLYYKVKDDKVTLADDVTWWKAFNDVSEILTLGKLSFRSTLEQYRNLDSILVTVA